MQSVRAAVFPWNVSSCHFVTAAAKSLVGPATVEPQYYTPASADTLAGAEEFAPVPALRLTNSISNIAVSHSENACKRGEQSRGNLKRGFKSGQTNKICLCHQWNNKKFSGQKSPEMLDDTGFSPVSSKLLGYCGDPYGT